jgi:hypothetical protein
MRVRLQRLTNHLRAEVRAADADVDDVGDLAAGVAAPHAGTHGIAETAHPGEHGRDLLRYVDAVDDARLTRPIAQRNVQHRAVLGAIDPLAREHRVAIGTHAGFARKRDKRRNRMLVDQILRVVHEEPRCLVRKLCRAFRIAREQRADGDAGQRVTMASERLPRRHLGQ